MASNLIGKKLKITIDDKEVVLIGTISSVEIDEDDERGEEVIVEEDITGNEYIVQFPKWFVNRLI